jgi:type VI secretion system secreted protein VgrG
VVQYRETDLQFISRLAEHWGICFFFEHYEGGERMVFADDGQGHVRVGYNADIPYRGRGEPMDVFKLELERKLVPAHYICRDYNYRTPLLNVQGEHRIEGAYAGAIVDYGSHCKTPDEAKLMARVRAEERGATREVYTGLSDQMQFHPGATFELNGHPRYGGEMMLLEVRHEASQSVHGHGEGAESTYSNTFRAIPASTPFRPPRLTPVPRIHGVVTGVVETGSGLIQRYAKLDGEGRYRVKFLFDTAARGERQASKDVRMLQPSAGENYGVHFPLKPGTEVLITFLDGDPDRPLIVGSVPNPVTPTPVAEKIHRKSRIKSESGVIIEIEDGNRPR